MTNMYPTTSAEKNVYLKYTAHITVATGRTSEALSLEGIDTISDILSELDKKYPGFKELFMPTGGIFNSKTGIHVKRVGKPTLPISDEKQEIEDGDTLLFW